MTSAAARAGCVAVLLAALPAAARTDWRLDDPVEQGRLVRGWCAPPCTVRLDETVVSVTAEGRFVLGFHRDHGPTAALQIDGPDGEETVTLDVRPRAWDIQRIDGLPPAQVTPSDPAVLRRIEAERAQIRAARAADAEGVEGLWQPWVVPVAGPVSGVFGSQRILNGQPRAPHLGLDLAAPEGTPIGAAAGGVVTLAHADLFFTGGTVIIAHGQGVTTIYAHLARVDVETGERVEAGETIGAVGRTGRATGPHLHLGVYWRDRAVDPAPLLPLR